MIDEQPTIYIVDDDPSARRGISRLVRASGMNAKEFDTAQAFLEKADCSKHGCIVLDVKMPVLNGLDLQSELIDKNIDLPIIFVSGHSEVPDAALAMKRGAVDFLVKPVDKAHLFKAISQSLKINHENCKKKIEKQRIQKRLNTLTPRELTIMKFVITGMPNKQTAFKLDITEDTVKVHRGRVMKKMKAESLVELVQFAETVKLTP